MGSFIKFFAIATVSMLTIAGGANAQSIGYLAGTIQNKTDIVITYQYRENNGPWKTVYLLPGKKHVFSYRVPGTTQTIHLRFDRYLGDNKVTFQNTTLAMHVCAHPNHGWPQGFIKVNDNKELMLSR